MRPEDRIANAVLDVFEKSMVKVISNLNKRIAASLANLELADKAFVVFNEINLQHSVLIYDELLDALEKSGYPQVVAQLQASDVELVSIIKETSPIVAFAKTSQSVINAMRAAEAFEFQLIGERAMAAIRFAIQDTVLTGSSMESLLGYIANHLDTRFKRYAWTYANTTRKEVIQAVHWEIAKDYDGERYWWYVGPDDDLTRPVCQIGIGRDPDPEFPTAPYFSEEEMLTFEEAFSEDRMYNCRHYFIQITEDDYHNKIDNMEVA